MGHAKCQFTNIALFSFRLFTLVRSWILLAPARQNQLGSPWPMASHPLAYKSKWKLKMVCDKTRTIRTWANNSNCNCSFDRWLNISLVRLLRRSIVRSNKRLCQFVNNTNCYFQKMFSPDGQSEKSWAKKRSRNALPISIGTSTIQDSRQVSGLLERGKLMCVSAIAITAIATTVAAAVVTICIIEICLCEKESQYREWIGSHSAVTYRIEPIVYAALAPHPKVNRIISASDGIQVHNSRVIDNLHFFLEIYGVNILFVWVF